MGGSKQEEALSNGITLLDAIRECIGNDEFMQEYRRLSGASLLSASPIENMIDEATGKLNDELKAFVTFIAAYVWFPVLVGQDRQ